MGWWVFVGEAPKEYAHQARTNLGLWDGIPLGFKGEPLLPKLQIGNANVQEVPASSHFYSTPRLWGDGV
jgi:hypothetical protein